MKTEKSIADSFLVMKQDRRSFLRYAGVGGTAAVLAGTALLGCNKDDDNNGVNLGSGDTGILNYAYALEQLEAAFYIQVISSPFSGMTAAETSLLSDIRDHEIAHREFFKTALGSNAITSLEVDLSSINFSSRSSVLAASKTFEDLGVAAYNGAGKLLADGTNLLIAGKIVSVEARHAALIRELISINSFAATDVVDPNGFDKALMPAEVLSLASSFIKTKINASNLPTS